MDGSDGSSKRADTPQLPIIQTVCNCILSPTHMTGEQLLSCRHQRWKVKAKEVVVYNVKPYTGAEATIQQAAMVARTVNGELSGV